MSVFYSLVPLPIAQDENASWVAKVKTQRATIEDAARMVIDAGNEYTYETLIAVFTHMEKAIRTLIGEGYSITTMNASYLPVVKGVFARSGEWDEGAHSFSCTVRASKSLKADLATVKPAFIGQVSSDGGAAITGVEDATTGRTDGTITAGGAIVVTGKKIKCVGATGEDDCTLVLLDAATGEIAAAVDTLVHNSVGRVVFVCPNVTSGSYVLELTTYWATGGPLKCARKITSDVLTVV